MSTFSHCFDTIELEMTKEAISLGKIQEMALRGGAKASPERLARFDKNMANIKRKSFNKVWRQRGVDTPIVHSSRGITDKVLVARDAAQGIKTVGTKSAPSMPSSSIPPSRGVAPTLITQKSVPSRIDAAPRGFVPDTMKSTPQSSVKATAHSSPTRVPGNTTWMPSSKGPGKETKVAPMPPRAAPASTQPSFGPSRPAKTMPEAGGEAVRSAPTSMVHTPASAVVPKRRGALMGAGLAAAGIPAGLALASRDRTKE